MTTATPTPQEKNLLALLPYMRSDQKAAVDKISELTGLTHGAAIALQLCREQLRDYCPPDETAAVVAALLGLESRKREAAS